VFVLSYEGLCTIDAGSATRGRPDNCQLFTALGGGVGRGLEMGIELQEASPRHLPDARLN